MGSVRQNWQMWSGVLSEEKVSLIHSAASNLEKKKATVFNDTEDEVRSSRVCWLDNVPEIKGLLIPFIDMGNKNAFGVDLNYQAEIQYTEYYSTEGGHYGWHQDINWGNPDPNDRKLSITVQLSDGDEYEGGTFEFSEVENPPITSRKKGTVLIFPSYLFHRVTPVTKGVRRSLVAWFWGPRWR